MVSLVTTMTCFAEHPHLTHIHALSETKMNLKQNNLCPVFVSCLMAFRIFWQPAPILLFLTSVCSPGAQLPTKNTEILSQSRVILHCAPAHNTGLQNSQHTCRRLGRRIDKVVANPHLIWHQVQIRRPFGFQSHLLEGFFANRVSYLLHWSLAAFCLLDEFHSPLEQMGVWRTLLC